MQIYRKFREEGQKRLRFFVKRDVFSAFNKVYAPFWCVFHHYFVILLCVYGTLKEII
jgi:hypothetical protein